MCNGRMCENKIAVKSFIRVIIYLFINIYKGQKL